MANVENIKDILKSEEGFRRFAYRDSRGFLTIGYGLCIEEGKGEGMSKTIADLALGCSVRERIEQLSKILPWFENLPDKAQTVIICMSYQLGVSGVLLFRKFLDAIKNGNYEIASFEMLDSAWAHQTPDRAQRMSEIIRSLAA